MECNALLAMCLCCDGRIRCASSGRTALSVAIQKEVGGVGSHIITPSLCSAAAAVHAGAVQRLLLMSVIPSLLFLPPLTRVVLQTELAIGGLDGPLIRILGETQSLIEVKSCQSLSQQSHQQAQCEQTSHDGLFFYDNRRRDRESEERLSSEAPCSAVARSEAGKNRQVKRLQAEHSIKCAGW